jgi:hypothetical protein
VGFAWNVSHPWARKDATSDTLVKAAADVPAYATVATFLATPASQPLAGAIRLALGDSPTSATIDVALGAEGIRAALANIPEIGSKVNVSKSGDANSGYRITVGRCLPCPARPCPAPPRPAAAAATGRVSCMRRQPAARPTRPLPPPPLQVTFDPLKNPAGGLALLRATNVSLTGTGAAVGSAQLRAGSTDILVWPITSDLLRVPVAVPGSVQARAAPPPFLQP